MEAFCLRRPRLYLITQDQANLQVSSRLLVGLVYGMATLVVFKFYLRRVSLFVDNQYQIASVSTGE